MSQGFDLSAIPVSGKTGTAQVGAKDEGKGDTSVFAGYLPRERAPATSSCAVVEQGGMGAQTAAPIVRRVIESMNGLAEPRSRCTRSQRGVTDGALSAGPLTVSRRRSAGTPARSRHLDLVLLSAAVRRSAASGC